MALVSCIVYSTMELLHMIAECYNRTRTNIKIQPWIVKATVNEEYWSGVVEEMFSDGKYTSSRLMVVEAYTDAVCDHMEKHHQNYLGIRRVHHEWLNSIKSKTM